MNAVAAALDAQEALLERIEGKHGGPGPHRTGTPQLVHAAGLGRRFSAREAKTLLHDRAADVRWSRALTLPRFRAPDNAEIRDIVSAAFDEDDGDMPPGWVYGSALVGMTRPFEPFATNDPDPFPGLTHLMPVIETSYRGGSLDTSTWTLKAVVDSETDRDAAVDAMRNLDANMRAHVHLGRGIAKRDLVRAKNAVNLWRDRMRETSADSLATEDDLVRDRRTRAGLVAVAALELQREVEGLKSATEAGEAIHWPPREDGFDAATYVPPSWDELLEALRDRGETEPHLSHRDGAWLLRLLAPAGTTLPDTSVAAKVHVQDRLSERLRADDRVTDRGLARLVADAEGPIRYSEVDADSLLEALTSEDASFPWPDDRFAGPDAFPDRRGRLKVMSNGQITVQDADDPGGIRDPDEVREALLKGTTARLVNQWARSSNNDDTLSLAIQRAVEDELGVKGANWFEIRASPVGGIRNTRMTRLERDTNETYADHADLLRAFVRAQYDETQDLLAREGLGEVRLYRGFQFRETEYPEWWPQPPRVVHRRNVNLAQYDADIRAIFDATDEFDVDDNVMVQAVVVNADDEVIDVVVSGPRVGAPRALLSGTPEPDIIDTWIAVNSGSVEPDLRPISSFTADRNVAEHFAGAPSDDLHFHRQRRVLVADVPAGQIFATPLSGVGCLHESEYVVLSSAPGGSGSGVRAWVVGGEPSDV